MDEGYFLRQSLEDIHKKLFSAYSSKLGQIHWYILKADNEVERNWGIHDDSDEKGPTELGKEIGSDPMHWWVFKRESEIDELQKQTKHVLDFLQKLKDDSKKLSKRFPKKYEDLISILKDFAESHSEEIDAFYEYVTWLHNKDALAPSVLFTYKVWGTTRRGDRFIKVEADTLGAEDPKTMKVITEIAFGLLHRREYKIKSVYNEVLSELYPLKVSKTRVITQTSYEVFDEFATFFEFIRNSLRHILVDIEKYQQQKELMKSEAFWRRFIEKAKDDKKTENQLWDFKKTLTMWHVKKEPDKAEHELDFCETLACLANANGGVLIIGVSDVPPREVLGIGENLSEIESRLKYTRTVIANYIKYDRDIVYFKQIALKDRSNTGKICLVVVIAQTEGVVEVKTKQGRFSYPIRRETGLERMGHHELAIEKIHIKNDNYDFIQELNQFIYDK